MEVQMNILLWILQVVLALFFTMAAVNQLFNYNKLTEQFAIYQAVPRAFWVGYAIISLLCAVGLVVTMLAPGITPIAALILAVQGSIFAGLYAYHAGFRPSVLMWGLWTVGPVVIALFIAWARFTNLA